MTGAPMVTPEVSIDAVLVKRGGRVLPRIVLCVQGTAVAVTATSSALIREKLEMAERTLAEKVAAEGGGDPRLAIPEGRA